MVRIINETEVEPGEVTDSRPPRISNNNNNNHSQSLNMDTNGDKKEGDLAVIPKTKGMNCCSNNNDSSFNSSASNSNSSPPSPSTTNGQPSPEESGAVVNVNPDSNGALSNSDSEAEASVTNCNGNGQYQYQNGEIKIPTITVDNLPLSPTSEAVFGGTDSSSKSLELSTSPKTTSPKINGQSEEVRIGIGTDFDSSTISNSKTDYAESFNETVSEPEPECDCNLSTFPEPVAVVGVSPPIVIVENVDDETPTQTLVILSEEDENEKKTDCQLSTLQENGKIEKIEIENQSQIATVQLENLESGGNEEETAIKPNDDKPQPQGDITDKVGVGPQPQEQEPNKPDIDGDKPLDKDPQTSTSNSDDKPQIKIDESDPVEKCEHKADAETTDATVSKEKAEVSNDKKVTCPTPTSTVTSVPVVKTTTTTSSVCHSNPRFNRGHHHHCPVLHSQHHPASNFTFQALSQAAAAANSLSNLLNHPHLPHPHGNFQHFQNPQHHHPHQNQGLTPGLGPPFMGNSGFHNHNQIPCNGSGKPRQHPQPHPQHRQHQLQAQTQNQNMNAVQGPAVPMQFGYFAEQEVPPWGAFCGGPGRLSTAALPPLDIFLGGGSGLGSPSSGGPLPTAIIPLPLDPNFPPAVLPSYPTNTNTPNTQSTSGYSTAGHSRSSSPMGPTNHGPGLLQHFDNGLLPLPPQNSGSNGSPNFVFAAASVELSMYPQFLPHSTGQFCVYFHINPGVSVSFSVGDNIQVVKGPMTVPLVSTNSSAPIPLPMQVPPGHIVQQIVDENGTLRHVIVSHQPPLIPIPNYAPNSQGQQFYGPSGFPGAHFTQMQPGVVPCPVPSPHPSGGGIGYSSSIPAIVQKDERTQRQYQKLRRKFEQKQQTSTSYNNNGSSYNNQPSIRKETVYAATNGTRKVTNGVPKSPANGGMEEDGSVGSTGSVTSTGTQEEDEENRTIAMTEMLSSTIPPTVTEVTARSAYVQWSHPDRISESGENKFPDFDVSDTDFRYEVFISEKSRDNRFRSIFMGSALSCRVKDLKPGSLYAITYCAMLGDVKGNTCTPANFTTLAAEPDPPSSPKPVSRSRSSIQFKWNPPLSDNGSKINVFVLEFDEGKGGSNFVEAYRGKTRQCTISKLQPAYSYQFRLAAVNQIGQSRYTSVVSVMTAGSPPTQPAPPIAEAGVKYLRLEWKSRDTDDEYTLQMEDPSTGHGFLPVYNGTNPNYLCIGLKRNSQYKFRLRAQNEEGHSKWSDDVVISTLPDRPGPPHKPLLKGRVHAHGFKVRWDPSTDTGGVPITAFALEIDQGNGGYEEIYRGTEAEFNVDRLSPGQSYALRVVAIGPGGGSDPSESCVITTEPVCPGKSHIPRTVGKPKSSSVHLKWSSPDWDGGSPVLRYEVGCTTPDNQTQEAYRGKEMECIVNRLLPGRAYLFQIRAFNRIGAGEWSDPLEVISGAGAPGIPSAPKVTTKTSHIVLISWTEPLNNGSAITEYRVQMAIPAQLTPEPLPLENGSSEEAKSEVKEIPTQSQPSSFTQVYIGSSLSAEVKGLQPASLYLFRVQATNGAGNSDWSTVVTHEMPASSPNGVVGLEVVASSSSISLSWKIPSDNGSSITHYNVMMGETLLVATSNQHVIDNLMPDTQYKIRVQAVNGVGPGAFSSLVKVSTRPLAPPPPKLECVSVAHFWMKVKWTEIASKNIEYLVQMINPYKDEFEVVYRGTASNCKVTRLSEDTEYQFRICALNGAGQGPFSDLYRFSTSKAPPSQVKGCKAELLKDSSTHRFEWFEVICNDTIEYQFQVANKKRDMDFKTMYRGTERRVTLNHDQLEEGMDYACRVCAIRVCGDDGTQLAGPYSNNVNFHVPLSSLGEDISASSSKSNSLSSKSQGSSLKVTNTFFTTLEEKMSKISYESRVGIVAVFALIILAFVISLITHHVVS